MTAFASCKTPLRGPTGPAGPSNLTINYASAYGAGPTGGNQPVDSPGILHVRFPITVTANGITHPNDTDFIIPNDGVYLLGWSFTGVLSTNPGDLFPILEIDGDFVEPFSAFTVTDGVTTPYFLNTTLSSQFIRRFTEGQLVSFAVQSQSGGDVNDPSFWIMQIAP